MSYYRPTSHSLPAVAGRDVPTTMWSDISHDRLNLLSCARHRRSVLLGPVSNCLCSDHLDILGAKEAGDGLQVDREVSRAARGWSGEGARLPPPKLLPVSVADRLAGGRPRYLAWGTVRASCSVAPRAPKRLHTGPEGADPIDYAVISSDSSVATCPARPRAAISQSGNNVTNSNRLSRLDEDTRAIPNLSRSDLQKAD